LERRSFGSEQKYSLRSPASPGIDVPGRGVDNRRIGFAAQIANYLNFVAAFAKIFDNAGRRFSKFNRLGTFGMNPWRGDDVLRVLLKFDQAL
jgi:hypothetical protein